MPVQSQVWTTDTEHLGAGRLGEAGGFNRSRDWRACYKPFPSPSPCSLHLPSSSSVNLTVFSMALLSAICFPRRLALFARASRRHTAGAGACQGNQFLCQRIAQEKVNWHKETTRGERSKTAGIASHQPRTKREYRVFVVFRFYRRQNGERRWWWCHRFVETTIDEGVPEVAADEFSPRWLCLVCRHCSN